MSVDITSVDLDVVDSPLGKSLSIGLKMSQDSRITSTSVVAIILVDSKLQTKTVNLFKKVVKKWLYRASPREKK